MKFGILGPVEVTVGGRPLEVGGARARAVLATLIVHANHVVATDQLIDELWPGRPADKAAASLQVRLSGLRKLLRAAAGAEDRDDREDRLTTQPPGYRLRVTPLELDARRFEDLVAEGRPRALRSCAWPRSNRGVTRCFAVAGSPTSSPSLRR